MFAVKLVKLDLIPSCIRMSTPTATTSSRVLRSHKNKDVSPYFVRQFSAGKLIVRNDASKQIFFIDVEGTRAFIKYQQDGDLIKLVHTNVPKKLEGRGLGKVLAKSAFEYVASNDMKMSISCEFLDHYLEKYSPEYKKYLNY